MFNYELIKHLRKLHNVTQKELAEKLNIARGTLANYETGKRTPDFTMLVRICDVFNVSMDLFFFHNLQQTERVSICEIFEKYDIMKK